MGSRNTLMGSWNTLYLCLGGVWIENKGLGITIHGGPLGCSFFLLRNGTESRERSRNRPIPRRPPLLIDEISMLHRGNIMANKVHRGLAQVPFGGKVVVCTGDVRQILPVVRDDNQNATVRASLLCSPLWRHVRILTLEGNMRILAARDLGQDATLLQWFADLLLAIGEGRAPPPPPAAGNPHATPPSPPPPPFMLPPPELNNDPIQLLHHVYGDFHDAHNRTEERLIDRAILTPKNKDVDAMNDHAVQSFPGEEKVYLSADRLAQDENEGAYPMELLNSMNPPAALRRTSCGCKWASQSSCCGTSTLHKALPTGHGWSSCTFPLASSRRRLSRGATSVKLSAFRGSTWTPTTTPRAYPSSSADGSTRYGPPLP